MTSSVTSNTDPKAYRLPQTIRPRYYEIALDARPDREDFSGSLTIELTIDAPTTSIELHALNLEISRARLTTPNGQTMTGAVMHDAEREIAVIKLDGEAPAGHASLALDYTGKLSVGLEGLYLSKDGPNEMLCTQCEVTGARAILPCWDEPMFKARFSWTVTTAPGQTVLTNGRPLNSTPSAEGESVTWRFAPTKPMSSYLIALAIGDFASTEERVVNGVPLRVWALKGKESLGVFALDLTAELLTYYEDYFAKPYHFDKLDNIGVPNFGAGAMENAGLIVSQEVALLLDKNATSRAQEVRVAEVTAHEFAHMWFGDLVTMRWWDDLWLNEAFASWMAYHAISELRPSYRVWDEIQAGTDAARAADSLANSHAIYYPVDTPRSVLESFDLITYEKGGAVLRMVHDFLGAEAFRAGLRTYMAEFAEGNASGPDLWRHLQQASSLPVGEVMESWILQAGHPLVDVALESVADGEAHLRVSQSRFYSAANAPASDQLWQVPMQVRYEDDAGEHTARYLLTERSATFPIAVSGELRWLYANAGEVGFYRQRLDDTLLGKLRANLHKLTGGEQKGLLRDQWALVSNGAQPIAPYLDTIAALSGSDDEILIGQLVGQVGTIQRMLELAGDEQAMTGFRAWVEKLFKEKMAAVGYNPQAGEPVATSRLRASLLGALANYARDAEAISQARAWQEREAANPNEVDPNLAPVAVNATARLGDAETYDRYLAIYESRKGGAFTPDQVTRYARAFGVFQPEELTARTLASMAKGEDIFPLQAQYPIIVTFLTQPATQQQTWQYLKDRWSYIEERVTFAVPVFIEYSGELPASLRDDVVAFWDAHLKGEFSGSVARALETMDHNAELRARTRNDLIAYYTR